MTSSCTDFSDFLFCRDLELNRSSSAVSMSCDNSDYSYAHKITGKLLIDDMTELLEEPVEEQQPTEQVGDVTKTILKRCLFD